MKHNGNGGPPLPAGQAIPIIGQPFQLVSWFPTVMGTCNCEAKSPLLMTGLSIAQCPACQRRFQIQGVSYNLPARQLEVAIGLVLTPQEADQLQKTGTGGG